MPNLKDPIRALGSIMRAEGEKYTSALARNRPFLRLLVRMMSPVYDREVPNILGVITELCDKVRRAHALSLFISVLSLMSISPHTLCIPLLLAAPDNPAGERRGKRRGGLPRRGLLPHGPLRALAGRRAGGLSSATRVPRQSLG